MFCLCNFSLKFIIKNLYLFSDDPLNTFDKFTLIYFYGLKNNQQKFKTVRLAVFQNPEHSQSKN